MNKSAQGAGITADAIGPEYRLTVAGPGGEPLHVDHGAPARRIGPNRPGVHQTKWVHRIEVIA